MTTPIPQANSERPPEAAPARPAPRLPILVVDDEDIVLAALRETLRLAKYDLVTFSNPTAAVEELQKQKFSVIITDHRMPGITGLDLLARARQLQPDASRILITAVLDLDVVIGSINKGEIFKFIVKPWIREEFLGAVAEGVQRYELLVEHARTQAATEKLNRELLAENALLRGQLEKARKRISDLEKH